MALVTTGDLGDLGGWLVAGGADGRVDILHVALRPVPGHELCSWLSWLQIEMSQPPFPCPLHAQGHSFERTLSRDQGHGQNETPGPQRSQACELETYSSLTSYLWHFFMALGYKC